MSGKGDQQNNRQQQAGSVNRRGGAPGKGLTPGECLRLAVPGCAASVARRQRHACWRELEPASSRWVDFVLSATYDVAGVLMMWMPRCFASDRREWAGM